MDDIRQRLHNDGDGRRRSLRRLGGGRSQAGDHIHLEPDELSGKLRESGVTLACVTDFEREVLAFDPAGRSKSLAEYVDARGEVLFGTGRKNADSDRPRHGLSAKDARVDEYGEQDQDEEAAWTIPEFPRNPIRHTWFRLLRLDPEWRGKEHFPSLLRGM